MAQTEPRSMRDDSCMEKQEQQNGCLNGGKKILVIGGSGYVGRLLVRRLQEKKYVKEIVVLDKEIGDAPDDKRREYIETKHKELSSQSKSMAMVTVQWIEGSLTDEGVMLEVCNGVDWVFHVATPSYMSTNKQTLESVNVEGTKTVIKCCRLRHIPVLVYCSSASVVFDINPIILGSETLPYVSRRNACPYNLTKAKAEQLVLSAHRSHFLPFNTELYKEYSYHSGLTYTDSKTPSCNSSTCKKMATGESNVIKYPSKQDGASGCLHTGAIRPHSIYGWNMNGKYGIIDPLLEAIISGRSKFIIGNGKNFSDFTHIDNVIHALLLLAETLDIESRTNNERFKDFRTASTASLGSDCIKDIKESCIINHLDTELLNKSNCDIKQRNKSMLEISEVGGNAYNITNGEPIKFWDFVGDLCEGLGYRRPSIYIPYLLVIFIVFIIELCYWGRCSFDRQKVRLLAFTHTYSIEKAKKKLKFYPIVSQSQSFKDTIAHIRKHNHFISRKLL